MFSFFRKKEPQKPLEKRDLRGFEQDRVNVWLSRLYPVQEFQDYTSKELYKLLKVMGGGIEGKEYWTAYGRRMALLALLHDSKVQFDIEERKKREKEGL
jgi:hypothetical protein